MAERPTIHLTNWSSRNPPHRGPGRVLSIMARPRRWEHGDGTLYALTPDPDDLRRALSGMMTLDEYRAAFVENVRVDLAPGQLLFSAPDSMHEVQDGDTLCCACSRAEAAAGRCHRVWVAELLREAGWRVVLDGEVLA